MVYYCGAKKAAEKTIWEFVEQEKPSFAVTVFLPPIILGPALQVVKTLKAVNFSNDITYAIWNGSNETVPRTPFPAYVSLSILSVTIPIPYSD